MLQLNLNHSRLLISAFAVLLIGACVPAQAATWSVTSLGDDASDPTTLRGAIEAATSGDTINIVATGMIVLDGRELEIRQKNIIINGPGANQLTISADKKSRGLVILNGSPSVGPFEARINGVTIQDADTGNQVAYGGGIYNSGKLTLTNTVIKNNRSVTGAGIFSLSSSQLTLENSIVSGNSIIGDGSGGGIYSQGDKLVLINSRVEGNSAGSGGGVVSSLTTLITDSIVSGNSSAGSGGGLMIGGEHLTSIRNSTISNNSALRDGGGVWVSGGRILFENNTLVGNTAASHGGAIYRSACNCEMNNNTMAGNSALDGGGIYFAGATDYPFYRGNLASSNSLGGNCGGTSSAESTGYNISDDSTCQFSSPSDQILAPGTAGLDPFGLRDNGGPSAKIALLSNSPAIDAIPAADCTNSSGEPVQTDQRGVARPSGPACDIGAFEFEQADAAGPVSYFVQASPNPVAAGIANRLTAVIHDSSSGGSRIASAEYTINNGPAFPMIASDGAFDEVTEPVSTTVSPFTTAGLQELCVRGVDAVSNTGEPGCVHVAVYDPRAGFIAGYGAVDLPGASFLGTFEFTARNLSGRSARDANLEFHFHAGAFNFESDQLSSLVVTGQPRAQFRGEGTINGTTRCKYEVDGWDGSYGPTRSDAFSVRIFPCDGGLDGFDLRATPLNAGEIIVRR